MIRDPLTELAPEEKEVIRGNVNEVGQILSVLSDPKLTEEIEGIFNLYDDESNFNFLGVLKFKHWWRAMKLDRKLKKLIKQTEKGLDENNRHLLESLKEVRIGLGKLQ